MKALELIDVVKEFDDGRKVKRVLDKLNFSIDQGELIAVVGPSGSGKSTFLSICGALLTPSSGTVKLGDKVISDLSQEELTQIRLQEIGFIFQSANLISYLTTFEQLQWVRKIAGLPESADQSSKDLLESLQLGEVLKNYPETLSGGEKQRVAVARAFINEPKVILADEPTASIDAKLGRQVVLMLKDLIKEKETAGVIVTHDDRILDLVDRVYHLENGQLKEAVLK